MLLAAGVGGFAHADGLPLDAGILHGFAERGHFQVLPAKAGAALGILVPEQIGNLPRHFILGTEALEMLLDGFVLGRIRTLGRFLCPFLDRINRLLLGLGKGSFPQTPPVPEDL